MYIIRSGLGSEHIRSFWVSGVLPELFYTNFKQIKIKKNKREQERGLLWLQRPISGIDLGTSSILVYAKGKGIVLKEPSVVAYDKDADKVRAIGEEARQMIGRTPGNIMAVRPMRQGVITDFLITERMLRYFIQKAMGRRAFRKPRISICVPSGVTEVERKAVEEATYQAGAGKC